MHERFHSHTPRRSCRRGALLLALVAATTLSASSARAALGTIDVAPAATILVPYFEVDLAKADGMKTIVGLQNTSATTVVTNVTVWSDLGIPVINFNASVGPNGVQSFSLRDVLTGKLPAVASALPGCSNLPTTLPAMTVTGLQAALTGVASATLGGKCAGVAHGDQIARGYVTIDVVSSCGTANPTTASYFASDNTRIASDANVLLADYFFVDPSAGLSQGDSAVHIEADPTKSSEQHSQSGAYSFYGQYVSWSGADHREALARKWTANYLDNQTDLIVWRDTQAATAPFTCGQPLSFYPLGLVAVTVFDTQEQPVAQPRQVFAPAPPSGPAISFGAATGRYHVGGANGLPVTARQGVFFLDLGNPNGKGPSERPVAQQSYVMEIHLPGSIPGSVPYGTGTRATPLDSVSTDVPFDESNGFPVY
jgi:hypothetical protein